MNIFKDSEMTKIKFVFSILILTLIFAFLPKCEYAQEPHQRSQNIQSTINTIQEELEVIRGKKFKHHVKIKKQSLADFGKYLDRMLERQIPQRLVKDYGKIVKKLGLYRGPEIEDYRTMAKMVMQSQAAAYYDPASETFYLVMPNLPEQMLNSVYAHELYHGFQDQHFNLEAYVLSKVQNKLNDDELIARQAVVEGEATYMMTLWTMKSLLGSIPGPNILQMSINMQTQMDGAKILEMLKGSAIPQIYQGDMAKAIQTMDKIPPFLLETMIGAYLKGQGFIFEIQKKGWDKVQSLYAQPPVSSEQILHPEKWLLKEKPFKFEWPSFENNKLFSGWKLLEANTIGELQWHMIFAEHQMVKRGKSAAAGWNGDIFAVLENQTNKDLLLLICSTWDTVSDAKEFYLAYQQLLNVKYPNKSEPVKVELNNKDVFIIEGDKENRLNNLLVFMKNIKKGRF
ncbi:MAG: hypothetical protein ACE5HX_09530 [bacterium]